MDQEKSKSIFRYFIKILQGAFVGIGAVLPGVSGGVLCVIFGIYKTLMDFLSHPLHNFKTIFPKLLPYGIGVAVGFLGIAKLLAFLLKNYEAPSICVFVGLIVGMLPSLFKEAGEQGRSKGSYISLFLAMITIFILLIGLRVLSVDIAPNFAWYLFCGFCLALSVIAPGMSFSTLLMPLGLYQPFVDGIGRFDLSVIIPGGAGALVTVILLSRAVNSLFTHHFSKAFHAIIGIVIAATVMIFPFSSFSASTEACLTNIICIAAGIAVALALDKFNQKFADAK